MTETTTGIARREAMKNRINGTARRMFTVGFLCGGAAVAFLLAVL